ncbi:MAG: hypothetical protein J7M18_08540 [Candidatus Eremiobacteraeota bacterium]|nr:hypothetical protein [Candidatus Eremiobacteraeota bacterium]
MALYKGDKSKDSPEIPTERRRLLNTSLIKGDSLEEVIASIRSGESVESLDVFSESVEVPTRDPDVPLHEPGLMDELIEDEKHSQVMSRKTPEEIENEAREKANKIITEAQSEASRLMEENRRQCESALEDARARGYEEGYEAGESDGREKYTALIEEAGQLFRSIKDERMRVLSTVEPEVARLAVEIAEAVIGQEVKMNSDIVLNMVKDALGKVKDREEITIRVNPEDLSLVESSKDSFVRFMQGIREYEITGDPRVEQGGCIIESNLGSVDSRLKTRIEAIRVAFENTAREYADGNTAESES